ncbi:3-isopropylmalate dehydratase [Desulfosporosinus sp. Tol-M]|nr:3-isopropylmalate dehydratase [Desulfosporosinus sp. Tol-M]
MIKGRVRKFGADIDTDAIIPARYANLSDAVELGKHCMENIDPDFAGRVQPGDIIVAETNFGCGSSREIAPMAIMGVGISCVIAKNFARIFFRNALNIGLPLVDCREMIDLTKEGDYLEIDLASGLIKNVTADLIFKPVPYPPFISELINAGGLVKYTRKKIGVEQA